MILKENYSPALKAEIESNKINELKNQSVHLKFDGLHWRDNKDKIFNINSKALNAAKKIKNFNKTKCRLVCNIENEYFTNRRLDYELYKVSKLYYITKIGNRWFKNEINEITLDKKYLL